MKKIFLICFLLTGHFINAQTTILNIDADKVIYCPRYNKAYVAVDANDPQYPNSVIQIDPISGTVEKHISLPESPFIIHQSSDQSYLYISYHYKPNILKINLEDFSVSASINTESFDVLDFAVIPSQNNDLIVIRGDGDSPENMVMYKNGIIQPAQANLHNTYFTALCFKNDGSHLVIHDRVTTESNSRLVKMLDDGIEFEGVIWDYLIPGFSFIKNHDDLIYDENGNIVDVFNDTLPKLIAKIPIYLISSYQRTGFEYSDFYSCYVYAHTIDYKGYISFFHGEHFNYLGSYALAGQVQIVYDLAVVDQDHFILVAKSYSGNSNSLILFSVNTKDKTILKQQSGSYSHNEKGNHLWVNRPWLNMD